MCEPSNTFTMTTTKIQPFSTVVTALLIMLFCSSLTAQEKMGVIEPLKKSRVKRFQYDMFAYASRVYNEAMTLIVINNNLYNKGYYSYSSHFSFGLNGFVSLRGSTGANLCIGYTHERIAEDKGLFGNNGVNANWLNADLSFSAYWFSAGMYFDVFLGSQINNEDSFSYEGINENCFNSFSSCPYLAASLRLTKLKVETRVGWYLKPHINPDKIAYYNLLDTRVSPLVYEIRLYYRLFTTGNRKQSPYDINSLFNDFKLWANQ